MPSIQVSSLVDLDALVTSIRSSGQRTVRRLREVLAAESGSLQVLSLKKFSDVGYVFFCCPDFKTLSRQVAFVRDGVQVWGLPTDQVKA